MCVRMMLNTAWDLLLSSFMLVAATVRDLFPSDIRDSMSCQRQKHAALDGDKWRPGCCWRRVRRDGPCSRTPPGAPGRPRTAPSPCAPSLAALVDVCREETLVNPVRLKYKYKRLFYWVAPVAPKQHVGKVQ